MIRKRSFTQREESLQGRGPEHSNYRLKFSISNKGCNQWRTEHRLRGNHSMYSKYIKTKSSTGYGQPCIICQTLPFKLPGIESLSAELSIEIRIQ
ncbi:hypothetical protein V6N13_022962 [Hibiscus sabdariffa]|uniref:Uncharacterized protein n=2 Tax=Hibiscus sabdariffa TaxID=183260 RepID=A0ABR2AZF7_9ROSI